jgi:hypothetical protein
LTRVINHNPTPQTDFSDSGQTGLPFGNTLNLGGITLKVPAGSVNAYKAANVWKEFGTITSIDE